MATEVAQSNDGAENIAVPPSETKIASAGPEISVNAPGGMKVIRRNGKVTTFDANKIAVAMTKAFLAVEGGNAAASGRVHNLVRELTEQLSEALLRRNPAGGTIHIEDIQDQVELSLMRSGEHKVARAYVLYREEQNRKRAEEAAAKASVEPEQLVNITLADGSHPTARYRAPAQAGHRGLQWPRGRHGRIDSRRYLPQPVRRRQGTRRVAGAGDERAHADREGAELLLRRGAPADGSCCAARRWASSIWTPMSPPSRRWASATRVFQRLHQTRRRARTARQASGAVRPRAPRRRAQAGARSAVHLPRSADPVRPLLHPHATAPASNCRRRSSCASPWAWRSTRSTARAARSSSTTCCRASTS